MWLCVPFSCRWNEGLDQGSVPQSSDTSGGRIPRTHEDPRSLEDPGNYYLPCVCVEFLGDPSLHPNRLDGPEGNDLRSDLVSMRVWIPFILGIPHVSIRFHYDTLIRRRTGKWG